MLIVNILQFRFIQNHFASAIHPFCSIVLPAAGCCCCCKATLPFLLHRCFHLRSRFKIKTGRRTPDKIGFCFGDFQDHIVANLTDRHNMRFSQRGGEHKKCYEQKTKVDHRRKIDARGHFPGAYFAVSGVFYLYLSHCFGSLNLRKLL